MDTGLGLLVLGVLTIAIVSVIFTAALVRLWKTPPTIQVTVSSPLVSIPPIVVNAKLKMPSRMLIQSQHVPSDLETKAPDEPIPEDILQYISQESELHAQDARKKHARALFADTGNWDVVFRMLQREDNPE